MQPLVTIGVNLAYAGIAFALLSALLKWIGWAK
jgi:uncharacterized membrane protein